MMAFIPLLTTAILLILKAKFRLKTGEVIFRVLMSVNFSVILFVDLVIFEVAFIDWDFTLSVMPIVISPTAIAWVWSYVIKSMRNQETETRSESQKLRDVLSQVQQVADQLSSSAEELVAMSEEVSSSSENVAATQQQITKGAQNQASMVIEAQKIIQQVSAGINGH